MNSEVRQLGEKYPECRPILGQLEQLDRYIGGLPIEQFFEPVSLIEVMKDERQMIAADANDLSSWTKHMAFSTRLRMRSLEPGILHELCAGHYLAGMVLLRSHMEAASLAAYCLQELTSSAQAQDFSPLARLIPKTLFGTALVKEAKKRPQFKEFLSNAEQRTVTICKAIEALDKFSFQEHASGQVPWCYGILCEFAHPNPRGTRGFVVHHEVKNSGWLVQYQTSEQEDGAVAFALDTLLGCMQGGYATSEMLRVATFRQELGKITYESVGIAELGDIWAQILRR